MIKLSKYSWSILMKILDKPQKEEQKDCLEDRQVPVELAEDYRELVCDELIEHGLDDEDLPTEYGLELEQLIDELGAYMYHLEETTH